MATEQVENMDKLIYIQLHESKKEGGQTHGAKGSFVEDRCRASSKMENSGRGRRDHYVGDRREIDIGLPPQEGGQIMALEKTATKGVYKERGKKGRISYVLMYYIQVSDPLSEKGWKWKPKGKRF